jgi:thiol-disulfide isomerase/thioredoxin
MIREIIGLMKKHLNTLDQATEERKESIFMIRAKRKWISFSLTVLLLTFMVSFNCFAEKNPTARPAKDFSLKDLQSKKVNLSDFRGKVVLLNFFATWCSPCRMEIPELVKIHQKYKNKDFVILGINLDADAVPFMIKTFAKDMKITYPVLMGTPEVAEAYQISGVPITVLINKEGKIHKQFDGLVPTRFLDNALKDLLEVKS